MMQKTMDKKSIMFLATTPFAVNAFLRTHMEGLSPVYRILLCTNTHAYRLSDEVQIQAKVLHVDFARKLAPWRDLRALFQLLKIFVQTPPHAVHSITPKAGLLGMLAAWLVRIPLRYHTFTGQVWVTRRGISRWVLKHLDKLIALFSTQVFADSQSQCCFLENEHVVRQGCISVLGAGSIAGVDIERFHPDPDVRKTERARASTPASSKVFLYVGRLVRDKGVFDLLAAFSSVAAKNSDVELWIVGPDEEGLLPQLEKLSDSSRGRVRWIDASSQPERYMMAADIFVLPSYREGFGSVIIEAASCGVPTIAYRIDGVVDAVVDESTGCLVPKGNIMAFAQAMERLAFDPNALRNMSQLARRWVIEHFSSTTVTAAWLAFYESELKKSHTKRDRCYLPRYEIKIKVKRTFDLVIVVLAMPFLTPLLIFVTVLVPLSSPGPALYWSNRVGRGNRIFKMPKFRSMRVDTPVAATHQLQSPSQWLTPIGSFLRRTSLDELPQLWSILKGDMSFVGPRPALFNQDDLISLRTDAGVHDLLPGLTGWAQVNGRDKLSIADKVKLDAEYLEKRSVRFDLWILWLTLLKVLRREEVSH